VKLRRGCIWLLGTAAGVALAGFAAAAVLDQRQHAMFAGIAASAMGSAALVSLVVEWKFGNRGPAAIATHWFGALIRVGVLVGLGIVGNRGLSPAESQAWWLWLLVAYLAMLVVETVWLVRTLDRQTVAATARYEEQGS